MLPATYNEVCAARFAETQRVEALEAYVMSEILPPIGDYANAVQLILNHYTEDIRTQLLIVGAYLASNWTSGPNRLLEYLQIRYRTLPAREKSIFWFLKAHHLRSTNRSYKMDSAYMTYLKRSVSYTGKFVNNRLYLEEAVSEEEGKKLHEEALKNICKVYSQGEIDAMTVEQLAKPEMFINEYVLGTHIPYVCYKLLNENQ